VVDSQVETVSFGEEKPRGTGSSEDAWAQNRRADLNYR
jgi:peptidoglycan-associated lipoprotein